MTSASGLMASIASKPLFSFGVISDVQHADIPDGRSFLGIPRYYRHSILILRRAVEKWNSRSNIHFSMNFGDIVDGFCPKEESLLTMKKVLQEFERFEGPVYHMIGNHCLYNLPRHDLNFLFKIPSSDENSYYDFSPTPEYKFVVLDSYDISTLGWAHDHPNTLAARRVLQESNPNTDKNSPNGMVGLQKRFLMFNGAVGKVQLNWLDNALKESTRQEQKVIVCCHVPLSPQSSSIEALLWNYDEVMEVIHRYTCVKACLAGHDHKGGYSIDSHGIHHRVFEAALECPPGSDSFGHIDVYHDRMILHGTGRMASTEMIFKH